MEFLNKIPAFVLILRPKNLLITGITLYILQYHVIKPLIPGDLALNGLTFVLFIITTLLIAASGNLVNDIFDREIDKINKPDKTYIPDIISVQTAWIYYFVLLLTGAATASYVAWQTNQWYNLWIYPLACWLLFQYAKTWKSTVITGNIVVSLFVAFVWGILFYAQILHDGRTLLGGTTTSKLSILRELCFTYLIFAFFINLIREIVKDLEDMEGDSKAGLRTLPLVKGEKFTLQTLSWLIGGLITAITTWSLLSPVTSDYMVRFFFILFVVAPLARVFILLKANPSPVTYTKASQTIKLIMFFALIALFLIQKNY